MKHTVNYIMIIALAFLLYVQNAYFRRQVTILREEIQVIDCEKISNRMTTLYCRWGQHDVAIANKGYEIKACRDRLDALSEALGIIFEWVPEVPAQPARLRARGWIFGHPDPVGPEGVEGVVGVQ